MLDVFGQKTACAIIVSFMVTLSAQPVSAADCEIIDVTDADSASQAAEDNINCLLARLKRLETELEPFRQAKGAILAFDRSGATSNADETSGYCPKGWEWFEPSGGRFIVGAGQHQNVDENGRRLTRYPSFLEIEAEALGGTESHTLKEAELPEHRHDFGFWFSDSDGDDKTYDSKLPPRFRSGLNTNNRWTARSTRTPVGTAGSGQAHNNMPPYVALFYCKRINVSLNERITE